MTDTVIKGSGNSRSIKSVPNLAARAPTYDKLLELLTGEGLPIDLGPLNPAGLNVRGTDLNKAALLKDATAALYGLGTEAVPDDVLALSFVRVQLGEYHGTGQFGHLNPNSLTFSFPPNMVIIAAENDLLPPVIFLRWRSQYNALPDVNQNGYGPVSWSGNSMSWNCVNSGSAYLQLNNFQKYKYMALK